MSNELAQDLEDIKLAVYRNPQFRSNKGANKTKKRQKVGPPASLNFYTTEEIDRKLALKADKGAVVAPSPSSGQSARIASSIDFWAVSGADLVPKNGENIKVNYAILNNDPTLGTHAVRSSYLDAELLNFYTKTEADSTFAEIGDSYTKAETDTNFLSKTSTLAQTVAASSVDLNKDLTAGNTNVNDTSVKINAWANTNYLEMRVSDTATYFFTQTGKKVIFNLTLESQKTPASSYEVVNKLYADTNFLNKVSTAVQTVASTRLDLSKDLTVGNDNTVDTQVIFYARSKTTSMIVNVTNDGVDLLSGGSKRYKFTPEVQFADIRVTGQKIECPNLATTASGVSGDERLYWDSGAGAVKWG
jgi:hypothetical protein